MFLSRAVFAGVLLAATAGHGRATRVRMIDLDETAAGRAISLSVGERVRVTLSEPGGTGYRWRVGSGCDGLLPLESEDRQGGSEEVPGSSGRHRWVFAARAKGSCELRLELARSWEKTAGKVILFPVTIEAEGAKGP